MKTTSCDVVSLTADLYACVIESKEERPLRQQIERLARWLIADHELTARDEQILSLP